jgi:hypothetical protein
MTLALSRFAHAITAFPTNPAQGASTTAIYPTSQEIGEEEFEALVPDGVLERGFPIEGGKPG